MSFLTICLVCLIGCNRKSSEKVIAQVYDQKLTESQIQTELDRVKITDDSLSFIEAYISNWVNQQVLVYNAKNENLLDKSLIENKVNNYRNQLLVHHYQNYLIKKQLDTVVTDSEIEEYYLSHKPDFQLKDYLVKVLYIKVSEDAPDIEKLSKWYRLNADTDEEDIIQYAGIYATNFYFDKNNWIYFDEITKEIPLTDINKDRFITKKSDIKFNENNYYYFLNIIDYKLKNAVSPIEFERDNIKERILNKRILKMRESINSELLKKAENENAIKIY